MMSAAAAINDLLIVGAGKLGRFIAAEWRKVHPDATVIGETRTDKNHDQLTAEGIKPAIVGATTEVPSFMVYCAPPSSSFDYPGAVRDAVARAGADTRVVFTSSSSVHGSFTEITEATGTGTEGRARVLAEAERHAIEHPNGLVVRFTGLYTVERGPHSHWLRTGVVNGSPDRNLNLIYRMDAAHAVVLALTADKAAIDAWPRRTLLAAARNLITRRRCCEVALQHPSYQHFSMPDFQPIDSPTGNTYNNEWTREVLGWMPKWESFDQFMQEEVKKATATLPSEV